MPPSAGPPPDAPLSIAYLTYRGKPHVGGQGVYTRHLTKALVDLGHHVEVLGGQPYPVLDPRVPITQLRSLDLWNDHYPGRFPAYWEFKTREDFLEIAQFMTGSFAEPLAFSARAHRNLKPRVGEFDLVHDNQCLGYGILKIEAMMPTIVTLHHPITKDRQLEMDAAPTRSKRYSIGRWYSFVKMQGRVASRMPRIVVVSENSINDIHTDMGVSYDRMRLVPVGVDPDLYRPLPGVARVPGRLITTASADVALKGLAYLLEAMAKLRTERDVTLTIIGKPKTGKSMDLIDRLELRPHIDFVSGVPDERIVELYAEAELAVVPSLYEGFSLPCHRGDVAPVSRSSPPMAVRCPRSPAPTATRCCSARPAMRARSRRRSHAASTTPRCVPASARPDAVASIDRWSWRRCAEMTVDQYREVLAMPHNVEKLRRNGRI